MPGGEETAGARCWLRVEIGTLQALAAYVAPPEQARQHGWTTCLDPSGLSSTSPLRVTRLGSTPWQNARLAVRGNSSLSKFCQ
jgi:hypothetical protein